MRGSGLVLGTLCAAISTLAAGANRAAGEDSSFPYTAFITTDDTYVRSGPGKSYYPTDKLARGDKVEVYRHDPGGWYAIRPPRGSFSWVPARLLQPTKNSLAIVTGDRVVSRVGSRFSDVRDVIQVRLDRGEEVEILDVKSILGSGQTEQWCKIAPPAGEFRWVFGRFVDRNSSGPAIAADRSFDRNSRRDRAAIRVSGSSDGRGDADPRDAGANRRYYMADLDAAREPDDDADDHPIDRHGSRHTVHRTSDNTNGSGASGSGDNPPPPTSADAFQAEIDAIDQALSAMVVEEPTVWKFEDLDRRARAAVDHAQTAVERGKAHLLLDRIARFEDIQRRNDTIGRVELETDRKNLQLGGVSDVRTPAGLAAVETRTRFDAEGRLVTVASQRPNAPSYALVNADREVVAFITAAPGVNLKPLVGRQIGVSGQRGFMPEFKKPHITALRFEPLDNPPAIAAGAAPSRG